MVGMENPDKSRKNKIMRLGMSGLDFLGTVATEQPAEAAPQKVPAARSETLASKNAVRGPVDTVNQFIKGLNALQTLPAGEVQKLEETIEKGDIPLSLQINFLEKSLKAGSIHHRELIDPKLSEERFSKIIKIVDAVSARLTLAYQAKNTPPEIQKYFDIKSIVAATRTLELPLAASPKESLYSNGFLARTGGDVYFATAAHSVQGTTTEKEYTFGSNSADIAVKYIPQKDWGAWRVNDPAELLEISDMTTVDSVSGSVVVSYSWSPKNEKGLQEQKVHFSFAMPFYATARALTYDTKDQKGDVVKIDDVLPQIKSTMMFLKPHGEGKVIGKRPNGTSIIPAIWSSGSVVGTFMDGKYKALGNLVGVSGLNDPCRRICYAISWATTPEALRGTIKVERDKRLQRPITTTQSRKERASLDIFNPRRLIDQ